MIQVGHYPAKPANLLSLACLPLALFLLGCSSSGVTTEKARAMSTPGLGPEKIAQAPRVEGINVGDQVQISVLGYPEFNTTAIVREAGTINIPLIGEMRVVGYTREELTEEIVKKLSEYVKTKVFANVTVTAGPSSIAKIVILGAVTSQGTYTPPGPVSIFTLLASVGGPTREADVRHIKVYRNGDLSKETEIDLSGIVAESGKSDLQFATIYPGDMVYIPQSQNFIREFSPFIYDVLVLLTLFRLVN